MDSTLVIDFARGAHLLGLAMGFGIAMLADLCAARALVRPLEERELGLLQTLHRMVTLGLVILWASGLTLLWARTGFDPAQFSPKLMTKLIIVGLLTANALAIGRIALPVLNHYDGYRFGQLPFAYRAQLSALAGLSFTCWVSALALGVFSALKTMPYPLLGEVLAPVFLVGLCVTLLTAFGSPLLSFIVSRRNGQAGYQTNWRKMAVRS